MPRPRTPIPITPVFPQTAYGRSATTCKRTSGLDSAVFITATEPEDWDSLRRWVVLSDLPARNEVLAVIDTVSDPDARDAGIRQIDNGATYLRLLHEVYPQLRRVDYRISYTLPRSPWARAAN